MSSQNTRSIGVNTDLNSQNRCHCQENFGKMNFMPYFLPFPYPICNCMFSFFQKNMMENENNCNSHCCLHCSSSLCKNWSNKSFQCSEEKTNISSVSSEPVIQKSNENVQENEASSSKKFNEEYSKINKFYNKSEETTATINHLLKPNTVHQETEDSEDCSESDNEEINEDSLSGKTVLRIPSKDLYDRRPTRINLPSQSTQSLPQRPQNKNSEAEMLMMIKALVNNQYSNSSPHLNKLLNHIGAEKPGNKQQLRSNLQQK